MIEYYCGHPKSGKSLLAEKKLANLGGRILYVGTLPNILLYEAVIQVHRARRPPDWTLYECTGEPTVDINHLNAIMDLYNGMLIDGLAFYLQRASCYYQIGKHERNQFDILLGKAASSSIHMILVDQPVPTAQNTIAFACRIIHEDIYRYSDHLYYVNNGNGFRCSSDYLRARDYDNQE